MAQAVRADVMNVGAELDVLINHPSDRSRSDARPLVIHKDRRRIELFRIGFGEKFSANAEVILQGFFGMIAEWHDPFLAPLAFDAEGLVVEVNVGEAEIDQLGNADAAGV